MLYKAANIACQQALIFGSTHASDKAKERIKSKAILQPRGSRARARPGHPKRDTACRLQSQHRSLSFSRNAKLRGKESSQSTILRVLHVTGKARSCRRQYWKNVLVIKPLCTYNKYISCNHTYPSSIVTVTTIFLFRAMPSSRMRNKVYKYAVFFFPDGNKIGTAPTSTIRDGYKTHIKQGEIVRLNWEGSPVLGKIIFLHGKYWFLSMSTIRVTRLETAGKIISGITLLFLHVKGRLEAI